MSVVALHSAPRKKPFMDAVAKKLNLRVSTEERSLLATYERFWLMTRVVGPITGHERRYVKYLADKYQSFLSQRL